jgi:SAM-dependent methyltransferase
VSSDAVAKLGELLACPDCISPITVDVERQTCLCPQHGEYRFAGPFPSFLADDSTPFEDHWDQNAGTELPARKLAEAQAFLEPLVGRFSQSSSLRLLDAGCGEGAHVAALSKARDPDFGDTLVGLDIAASALRQAQRVASPAWSFVRGDMMRLPFRSASFDAVFSFGVLALTPDPAKALTEMARILRPGGLFGLWIFSPRSTVIRAGLRMLRTAARTLGAGGTMTLANAIVPFYSLMPTRSGISLGNANWQQTREVLMSNLTPPYLHFLDEAMLRRLLAELGIAVLPISSETPLTLWGEKR